MDSKAKYKMRMSQLRNSRKGTELQEECDIFSTLSNLGSIKGNKNKKKKIHEIFKNIKELGPEAAQMLCQGKNNTILNKLLKEYVLGRDPELYNYFAESVPSLGVEVKKVDPVDTNAPVLTKNQRRNLKKAKKKAEKKRLKQEMKFTDLEKELFLDIPEPVCSSE